MNKTKAEDKSADDSVKQEEDVKADTPSDESQTENSDKEKQDL